MPSADSEGAVVRRLPATSLTAASAEMKRRTFEAEFFKVTRSTAGKGSVRQGW